MKLYITTTLTSSPAYGVHCMAQKYSRPSSEGVNISLKLIPCGEFGSTYLVTATAGDTLLPVCGVFTGVQTMVWLPMFWVFNTCTDLNASDCTPTKV